MHNPCNILSAQDVDARICFTHVLGAVMCSVVWGQHMETQDIGQLRAWVSAQAFVYVTAEFETAQHQLNQAVVWSRIVESRAKAAIRDTVRMEYPYALTDPGDPPWPCRFCERAGCNSQDWHAMPRRGATGRQGRGGEMMREIRQRSCVPGQRWAQGRTACHGVLQSDMCSAVHGTSQLTGNRERQPSMWDAEA